MIEPYYKDDMVTLYCGKCESILPQLEVRVDLLLTDPPYGIGAADYKRRRTQYGKSLAKCKDYGLEEWDTKAPERWVLDMLQAHSQNQIVWGGNYFELGASSCWLVWDKDNGDNGYADCELAWTSFESAVRYFKWKWHGMLQQDMSKKEVRVHPTQKPLALMKWCIDKYSERGELILDPFAGSGTTLVAAKLLGRKSIGIEMSEKYCKIIVDRLNKPIPLFEQGEQEQLNAFAANSA